MAIIRRPEGGSGGEAPRKWTPIAEGWHAGRCVFAQMGQSRTGRQRIEMHFDVAAPSGGKRKLRYWLPMSVDWRVEQLFENFKVANPEALDTDELIGQTIGVLVEHEHENGKIFERIDKLGRAPDGAAAPIHQAGGGYGRRYDQPAPAPAAIPGGVDDDDCPF